MRGLDGIGYIAFVTESIEPRHARWTVGEEAAVVGFPPTIEFEQGMIGLGLSQANSAGSVWIGS